MIAARKRPAFNFLLRRWLLRVVRRRFHNVYVSGENHFTKLPVDCPVIGCVNHTNWWDGFVLYLFSHRQLPHDIYLAMEEANLRRYRFFTWMGAFGVDLTIRRSALAGTRYALTLLRETGRKQPPLVWMFVQGKLLRPMLPVKVKPGATFLARRANAHLLPLVVRYEWLGESRPSIFIKIGEPLPPDATSDQLTVALNRLLAEVDHSLDASLLIDYKPWFAPGMSMNKRWDRFLHWFGRGRETFDPQNNLPG